MDFDVKPLVPLPLDRVIGDKPITSSLPILRLPIELIDHITPHLSPPDVRNLALVDRDSNQLARTLQFAHVKFDYSHTASQLLARLTDETRSAKFQGHRIGACIRRLTVSTIRHHWEEIYLLEDGIQELLMQEPSECIRGSKQAKARYLHTICELLPHLPNLHIIDWNDQGPLTSDMMELIMASSITQLRLNGPLLDVQFTLPCPPNGSNWPLDALSINVGWSLTKLAPGNIGPFVSSILRVTAPTLRQLVWCGSADRLSRPCSYDEDIHFPVLRHVVFDHVKFRDTSLLDGIFDKQTLVRSLSVDSSSIVPALLARRGHVPSLVCLRWNKSPWDAQAELLAFLHENPQLSCLQISVPLPSATVDDILFQKGHLHFDHLAALHLISKEPEFSQEALRTIAQVRSLEHLWLSAGAQSGMRHEWAIDHGCMMDSLQPLSQLTTIAFTRDSYQVNGHILLDTTIESYYTNKILPKDLLLSDYLTMEETLKASGHDVTFDDSLRIRDSLRCLVWERWHRSQMVMHATEYSKVFGQLEWCFVGQLPLRIENGVAWSYTSERHSSLDTLHARWARIGGSL